jgi:hypothetical protein
LNAEAAEKITKAAEELQNDFSAIFEFLFDSLLRSDGLTSPTLI